MGRIIFYLLATFSLFASDLYQKSFEKADLNHNVNQGLLRAIGYHESGLNPCVVGFVVKDPSIASAAEQDLKESPLKFKVQPYKSWKHFAIYFKDTDQAVKAIPWLEKVTEGSTGFDVGVMQINSRNATRNGWSIARLISEPDYNIDKGAKILSDCRDAFKSNPPKTLECYNKGAKTENFDYKYYQAVFAKFMGGKIFLKDTGQKIAQAEKDEFKLPKEFSELRTLY